MYDCAAMTNKRVVARYRFAWAGLALALGILTLAPPVRGAGREDDANEINLAVGGHKVINANGLASFEESSNIVKITTEANKLILTGIRPGSSSLLLIYGNGKQEQMPINVYARSPAAIRSEVKTLMNGMNGVDIREVGGRIFLDGAVPTPDDLARIDRIVALYAGQVASLVTVDASRQRTNIKLDLHFVQFSKTSSHKFGVNWPGNIGAHMTAQGQPSVNFNYTYDFIQRAATSGQLVIAENLLPSLDILGTRGWAKINNAASIITTNGGTATYHTGGEVNVKISTSLGQSTLQKINFGVQLTVTPRLDPVSGLIIVTIDAEQSQLQVVQGQDVPGRSVTQTKTSVHVKLGQSIMLSGFKEQSQDLGGTGIPGLMQIPILGYLFRTETGDKTDTENVLFITPTVIEHTSPENARRIEDALKSYEDYGGTVVY
jgi:pilus assembly protein CpaC